MRYFVDTTGLGMPKPLCTPVEKEMIMKSSDIITTKHTATPKILRAGHKENFIKNNMHVNINVSDICNFSCSYCINNASKDKGKRILHKEILKQFIEDIADRKNDTYFFAIAGGEPLLYPHINFLVKIIDETILAPKTIAFATNASLLLERGEALYTSAKNTKIRFSVSVHTEQIEIVPFAEKITKFGHSDDLKCKILFLPGKLQEIKEMLEIFNMNNIQTILSVVNKSKGIPFIYSAEELEFISKHPTVNNKDFFNEYMDHSIEEIDRITRGLHPEKMDYQGMKCLAGRNALRLAPDGTCARCFGFLRNGEKFNLAERRLRDIPELSTYCVCPADVCTCLSFIQSPKWRFPEDKPSYIRE